MKRYYSEEEIKEIMMQDLQIPEVVEQKMSEAYEQIRQKKVTGGKVRGIKKYVVLAAALATMAATSLVVLAAGGFFQKEVVEKENSVDYEFEINYELSPSVFEVITGYLPDGYTEMENEKQKYSKNAEDNGGISIFLNDMTSLQWKDGKITVNNVDHVEKTTINGLEAHVITSKDFEKYRLYNEILLFNQEEGYIVEVFGYYDVPIDELKKVAEGLVINKVEGETIVYEDEEVLKEQLEADEEMNAEHQAWLAEGIAKEDVLPLGEEYKAAYFNPDAEEGMGGTITYTVKSSKFVDSLKGYESEYFYDYEGEILPNLNEDGTAKSHVRVKYSDDTGNTIIEEKEVGTKFLVLEVQAKNYGKHVADAPLYRTIAYLQERDDGRLEMIDPGLALYGEEWFSQDGPIYFSAPQHTEGIQGLKHFFWRDMQPNETLDYTLIYAIDEDCVDSVYLGDLSTDQENIRYMSIK